MFERFTDRARRVVVLAQEEARMLSHNYIGTEHILLGLLREGEAVAAKTLESQGISLEAARHQVKEIIGQGQQPPSGHIPFTARAKKTLELSSQESTRLGHNYIDTEHILFGLLHQDKNSAIQILLSLGADLDRIREHVTELPHPYPGKEPAPAAGPNQLRLAAGSHDVAASERSRGDALTLIGERLTAIERRLGISGQSPPDPRDEQIAEVRQAKEAAINGGELEKAAALSDQEKRLIEQKEASAREQWLRAEIARLQALLRRHGIDPGIDQGNPASVD